MNHSRLITLAAVVAVATLASPALADRTQVFTIRPEEGAFCESDLQAEMKDLKGVKKFTFDRAKLQLAVTSANGLRDEVILDAIKRARARCPSNTVGASIAAPEKYSAEADVIVLSKNGESIGPLKKHLVSGKYTVFDVYADWCGPCHLVDKKLRQIMATRNDIALRKINLVDYNRPVAKEIGPRFRGLPYIVIFDPKGKRTDIVGANLDRIASALAAR